MDNINKSSDFIETSFVCPKCKKEIEVKQAIYWSNDKNNTVYRKRCKINANDGEYNYSYGNDNLSVVCPHCKKQHEYQIVVRNNRFTLNLMNSNEYLLKYKGKYRIKAELDLDTMDFVKDADGTTYEDSFADFYIDCKNHIKIKHGCGNELSCYIPSTSRGLIILRQIFNDKIKHFNKEKHDNDYIVEQLLNKAILVDCDVLDGEVYFIFKATMIDYIAELVEARTSGANISPFSNKNLPKTTYVIPEQDIKLYKKAKGGLDMLAIKNTNNEFITEHNLSKEEQKKVRLKSKEFFHSKGLWNKYCEFIKEIER